MVKGRSRVVEQWQKDLLLHRIRTELWIRWSCGQSKWEREAIVKICSMLNLNSFVCSIIIFIGKKTHFYSMRCLIGSKYNFLSTCVMCSNSDVLVTTRVFRQWLCSCRYFPKILFIKSTEKMSLQLRDLTVYSVLWLCREFSMLYRPSMASFCKAMLIELMPCLGRPKDGESLLMNLTWTFSPLYLTLNCLKILNSITTACTICSLKFMKYLRIISVADQLAMKSPGQKLVNC